MLQIKKILSIIVVLCMIFGVTACSDSQGDSETVKKYTDQEIYNAFLEAYQFHEDWIYGQYYVDSDTVTEENGIYFGQVDHDTIKTAEQLTDKINSYFSKARSYEYIKQLQPHDNNGKLYINCNMGIGGKFIGFKTYRVERIDEQTYILTINLIHTGNGDSMGTAKVLCVQEDGKLLFDNHSDERYYYELLF